MWQIKMIPFGKAGMAFIDTTTVSSPEWEATTRYIFPWNNYAYQDNRRAFFGMISLGVFQEEA